MATQPREKRIKNFNEVALGYSKKLTQAEAKRCPQCTDPVCMRGCPLGIDIPAFIRLLREGNVSAAYQKIKEQNSLPSICGRVCSSPCELACILKDEDQSIDIRSLERYASDYGKSRTTISQNGRRGKKVAIIGSGPAGLAAATGLAERGYQVTVFESMDKPGGILRYGIPEFRIPKRILDGEINDIKALGVNFQTNVFVGKSITLDELKSEYSAVLLSMGAGVPKFMDLKGAHYGGVYYGEEFLMRINLTKSSMFSRLTPNVYLGQRVAVIGSGNTALDCARAAARLSKDVTLVYRRTDDEMRVKPIEREYAKEEGIKFESLTKPIEIIADDNAFVAGLKCMRMDYADVNVENKWELTQVPDSEFIMDVDTVIIAIGHNPNALAIKESRSVQVDHDGSIAVDVNSGMTTAEGIFAAGNVVTNAGPIVEAIAAGKNAVDNIDKYLKEK